MMVAQIRHKGKVMAELPCTNNEEARTAQSECERMIKAFVETKFVRGQWVTIEEVIKYSSQWVMVLS